MAKAETSFSHERPETAPEFSRRVADAITADSWQGVDRVGCDYPEPGEVIEYPADDEKIRIYKRRDAI